MNPELLGVAGRCNLAQALEKAGDLQDAAQEWNSLVQEVPSFRAGWLGWLEFLFHYGDCADSLEFHRQYLDRWPTDAMAWHNQGMVLIRLGRFAEAIDSLERSLVVRPGYPLTVEQMEFARAKARSVDGHAES